MKIYKVTTGDCIKSEKYYSKRGLETFFNDYLKPDEDFNLVVDDEKVKYQDVPDFQTLLGLLDRHCKVNFAQEETETEDIVGRLYIETILLQ